MESVLTWIMSRKVGCDDAFLAVVLVAFLTGAIVVVLCTGCWNERTAKVSRRSRWGDDDDKVRRGASVSYRSPVHCQTLLGTWSDLARPPLVLTVAVVVDASKCVNERVELGESGQQDGRGTEA